jgi:hypothetical protein
MHAEPQGERYDPFQDDEDLLRDITSFGPRPVGEVKARPNASEVEQIALARGFDNRDPSRSKPVKEPLKPLQFRLPQSEVDAFHQAAFEEFGPKHGAKTALFLKLWRAYQDTKA